MSACDEVLEVLTQHVAGSLRASDEERVRAHLAGCSACRLAAHAEARLHGALEEAVTSPVGPEHLRDLLSRARARAEAPPAPAPITRVVRWPRQRLLGIAAGLLVAALLGLFTVVEPRCLVGDCPTKRLIQDAMMSAPVAGAPPALGVPDLPGLQAVGVGQLSSVDSVPVAVYERERTRLLVFQEASAHTHFWYGQRLEDGRKYLVMAMQDGRQLIGWVDDTGRVWCCVGEDRASTLALASDLRQRTS